MARPHNPSNTESFNLRVDGELKAAFSAAAAADDRSAAQVLRRFMRLYVARRAQRAFATDARRQSLAAAEESLDPHSDEAAVMRELEGELDASHPGDEWR